MFDDLSIDYPRAITTGYPDGSFRPTAVVQRMAMAAFLHRYDELSGEAPQRSSPMTAP